MANKRISQTCPNHSVQEPGLLLSTHQQLAAISPLSTSIVVAWKKEKSKAATGLAFLFPIVPHQLIFVPYQLIASAVSTPPQNTTF